MKKVLQKILALFLVFAASSFYLAAQNFPVELQNRFQTVLDTTMQNNPHFVAGISLAVYSEEHGFWEGTSGVSSINDPASFLTTDTLFHIYSITKTFTSAMILKLMAANQLNLDDPISQYLTIENVNINSQATIRQLLNHSTGFDDYVTNFMFLWAVQSNPTHIWEPVELLQYVATPDFETGTSHGYSSTNYIILGMIIETVTGNTIANLFREHFFNPRGMQHSYFTPDETVPENKANPHDKLLVIGGTPPDAIADISFFPFDGIISATWSTGGIVSLPREIVSWGHDLWSGNILPEQASDTLINSLNNSSNYGYGVMRRNEYPNGAIGHDGGAVGYVATLIHFPNDRITVCAMVNQGSMTVNDIAVSDFVTAIYDIATTSNVAIETYPELLPADIFLFPNPVENILNAEFYSPNTEKIEIQLFNTSGTLVFRNTEMVMRGKNSLKINVENLPAGVYFLNTSFGNKTQTKKIVKQ